MAGFPLAGTYRTPIGVTENVMKKLGLHDVAGITRYAVRRHMVRA